MEEIDEIITKNFLASKSIPFKKLGEYAGNHPAETAKEEAKEEPKAEEGGSPSKVPDEGE